MRNTHLDEYFDFILASRELGFEKPNPLIFQRAIELAATDARNEIVPREVLHVGDHIAKDYEAAKVSLSGLYISTKNYNNAKYTRLKKSKNGTEIRYRKDTKDKFGDFLCINCGDSA